MPPDAFQQNISAVAGLIGDPTNKVLDNSGAPQEGTQSDYEDVLDLPMTDAELLDLRDEWEGSWNSKGPEMKIKQDRNKLYYQGKQRVGSTQNGKVVSSNLLFEAEETFIPQALSKNPEPVVFSDNSDDGKKESNDLKTMLQFHADQFGLRRKLGVMVRHWSIYFIAVMKYGWDEEINDIKIDVRKPQNFIFDPNGYVDEFGNYHGKFLGERIECTAQDMADMFPTHADAIKNKVANKMGTSVTRTEWWTNKYCFTTFESLVLDKHKNEFFNYPEKEKTDEEGNVIHSATPTINHFAAPEMPYTFLSVFSLQETPHDITSLIEQNVPNQDRINDRDDQITKNLASGQNSVAISGKSFTSETATQAVETFYQEGFLLIPDGNMEAVKRIPASPLPSGILDSQERDELKLRQIFGTQGITPEKPTSETTARGEILSSNQDASRIGGGVGDSLEQVAKTFFNWLAQLYCVFYDEEHYGAAMGRGRAVEYVAMRNTFFERKFVVSVAPNSMKPKDEVTQQNLAIERWNNKAIDPLGLMKELDDPDPMESAKRLVLWTINPQMYLATYFPEAAMAPDSANTGNPPGATPEIQGSPPSTLAAPPTSASLSQVPINTPAQLAT